jgi:hypothetical protein
MLAYLKDPANGFNLLAGEAEMLAEQFAMDTDALVEFGAAANAAEASQKAAFDAIATSAHQMVDTTGLS